MPIPVISTIVSIYIYISCAPNWSKCTYKYTPESVLALV